MQPQQQGHAQSPFSALAKSGSDLLHAAGDKIATTTGAKAAPGTSAGGLAGIGASVGGLLHQAGDKIAHLEGPGIGQGLQQGTATINAAVSKVASKFKINHYHEWIANIRCKVRLHLVQVL